MTRLLIATCTLAVGLGFSNQAQAQIVYGSSIGETEAPATGFFGSSLPFNPFSSGGYGGNIPAVAGYPGMGIFTPFGSTTFSPFGRMTTTPFGYGSQYTVPGYGGLQTAANSFTPYGSQTFSNFFSPFSFAGRTMAANYSPFGATGLSSYYSPYGGAFTQTSSNLFGGGYSRSFGYNPFNGVTFGNGTGVTTPTVVNPAMGFGGSAFGGYNPVNNLLSRELAANYLSGYNALLNQERNNFANSSGSWNNSNSMSGSRNGTNFSNSWNYSTHNSGNFNGAANSANNRHYNTTFTGSGSGPFGGYNFNLNYTYNNNFRRR